MTNEPRWVGRPLVEALHLDQLRTYGGRYGIRDENLLESALARPRQRWAYEPDADLFDLAAAYAFGLAKNHPFIDGNKRAAFAALVVFLDINDHPLRATEPDAIGSMLAVAAGEMDEHDLAMWARENAKPR